MRLRPFFSYYGSKHRIARLYPEPQIGRIIEPFAGSAAYACAYPHLDVLLLDANPKVAGVWDYLIRAPLSEIASLPLLGRDEGVEAMEGYPQEAMWLVGFWLGKGKGAPFRRPSAWRRARYDNPQYEESYWGEPVRRRISQQAMRIRHWKVRSANYWESPDVEGDWFIDPPYEGRAGKGYGRYGSQHLDYSAIRAWSHDRKGQVIVCEHAGASWLPFQPFRTTLGMNGPLRSGVSEEVVWHRPVLPSKQGELHLVA